MPFKSPPDLDAIARNLIALDLAHLTPEEAADYELELSAIASLNEALEISAAALKMPNHPKVWPQLYSILSDAAALLSSQLAPLLDLNAERSTDLQFPETPVECPLAFANR
mgnify:CR=1 FL=1